jgi:hypothetical protein
MNPHEHHTPATNGHKPFAGISDLSDFTYTDLDVEMPPRTRAEQDEKLADAVEQLSVLMLRMDSRLQTSESGKDKTALPNWLMPLICSVFIGLVVYAFTTVVQNLEKGNEKLERRLDTQETYMKNTREQLIAHGWTVDDQGNVHAQPAQKK